MSIPTRIPDSATREAPRWSFRLRQAETAGRMDAVKGIIREEGREYRELTAP
jgi:hypothetical protein